MSVKCEFLAIGKTYSYDFFYLDEIVYLRYHPCQNIGLTIKEFYKILKRVFENISHQQSNIKQNIYMFQDLLPNM